MILTTKGRYAVMAMVDLASQPEGALVGLAQIAERQHIPQAYLEQIFAKLKRAGLIDAVRGPGGGYKLARAPRDVSIATIIDASEELIKITRCSSLDDGGCISPKARCKTHDLWEGLGIQIYNYLNAVTLADVCERRVSSMIPKSADGLAFVLEETL